MGELGAARHRARERALELLYEAAMKDRPVLTVVGELAAPPDPYTVHLLEATARDADRALALIGRFSIDWPVDRLALLDRLILTLATCELLMGDAPPVAVVLDEAVELAKTYSTDGSPGFVNGVLSSIADDLTNG